MRRAAVLAALAIILFCGCGRMQSLSPVSVFDERDYQWHKQTSKIRVHWNYVRPDEGTIIADGYVEPFNPKYGLQAVHLELVGLDEDGEVVNSASGGPEDDIIMPPSDESYFRMEMKLNGREDGFTLRGSYYHFMLGTQPALSPGNRESILLDANEPR